MTRSLRRFTLSALFALSALFVSTLPSAGLAADAAPAQQGGGFAVFNLEAIMKDSLAQKSIREQIDAKQKSYRASLEKKEETLQKENQELAKQRSVLSPEAFEKKYREFGVKYTDAQKDLKKASETIENAYAQAMNEVRVAMADIENQIAKENNLSVIMPYTPLMYADPKLDITQEILKRLNAKLPKVTVTFK